MRNITSVALAKFAEGKPFKSGNTSVTVHDDIVRLSLHGNTIAKRESGKSLNHTQVSLRGYNTPTTRERVNGLLRVMGAINFFVQRNYESHLINCRTQKTVPVDSDDWFYMLGDGTLVTGELCDIRRA